MNSVMLELPKMSPEERRDSGIEDLLRFRSCCLRSLVEHLATGGEEGIGARALYLAVRDDIDREFGAGSYRWDTMESNLSFLMENRELSIDLEEVRKSVESQEDAWH